MSDHLDPDNILSAETMARFPEGAIPTKAIVIVEFATVSANGLKVEVASGTTTWQALGLLNSAKLHLEAADRRSWNE